MTGKRRRGRLLPLRHRRRKPAPAPPAAVPLSAAPVAPITSQPKIIFTRHALDRYQERIRPLAKLTQCRRELERLMAEATIAADVPPGVMADAEAEAPDAWLVLAGGSLICPLVVRTDGTVAAVSLYGRGSLGTHTRRRRNERRQIVAAGKRSRKAGERMGRRKGLSAAGEEWT
jgi:hypothetical protein